MAPNIRDVEAMARLCSRAAVACLNGFQSIWDGCGRSQSIEMTAANDNIELALSRFSYPLGVDRADEDLPRWSEK